MNAWPAAVSVAAVCTDGVLGGRRLMGGWVENVVTGKQDLGGSLASGAQDVGGALASGAKDLGGQLHDLGSNVARNWHNIMTNGASDYHDAQRWFNEIGHDPCISEFIKYTTDEGTTVNVGAHRIKHSMPLCTCKRHLGIACLDSVCKILYGRWYGRSLQSLTSAPDLLVA